jgi:signal transduction histidine kinase
MCCDQLLVIINDILDLSKIEAGKMDLELKPFYLKRKSIIHSNVTFSLEFVEDCLEVVAYNAECKGIELIADLKANLPAIVVGDCIRLSSG